MKKQHIALVVFLVLSVIIFFNSNIPPVTFISSLAQDVFEAPKMLLYGAKSNISQGDEGEIKKIKEENEKLSKKLVEFERVMRDNEALRSQFETSQTREFKLMPARILGSIGRFNTPSSYIIDKGEADGVKEGMGVVSGANRVGKIDEVARTYSRVILPLSSSFSTLATTSENQAIGVIKGQRDFILLDNVPIRDTLVEGETVLTTGEVSDSGIGIPKGLTIGKISSIFKNPSLPFQTARVESGVPFSKLETVFLILSF